MFSRIATVLVLLAGAGVANEDPAARFAAEVFNSGVSRSTLTVTGSISQVCAEVLGRSSPRTIAYYRSSDRGTLWILSAKGKHGSITAGMVVNESRIRAVRILKDGERRGRLIRSSRYLRQYEGLGLRLNGALDRSLDGITGATI